MIERPIRLYQVLMWPLQINRPASDNLWPKERERTHLNHYSHLLSTLSAGLNQSSHSKTVTCCFIWIIRERLFLEKAFKSFAVPKRPVSHPEPSTCIWSLVDQIESQSLPVKVGENNHDVIAAAGIRDEESVLEACLMLLCGDKCTTIRKSEQCAVIIKWTCPLTFYIAAWMPRPKCLRSNSFFSFKICLVTISHLLKAWSWWMEVVLGGGGGGICLCPCSPPAAPLSSKWHSWYFFHQQRWWLGWAGRTTIRAKTILAKTESAWRTGKSTKKGLCE